MPIFGYVCENCGLQQEHLLPAGDRGLPEKQKCPRCLKLEVIRLPSAPSGWMLRGPGWTRDGGAFKKNRGD